MSYAQVNVEIPLKDGHGHQLPVIDLECDEVEILKRYDTIFRLLIARGVIV